MQYFEQSVKPYQKCISEKIAYMEVFPESFRCQPLFPAQDDQSNLAVQLGQLVSMLNQNRGTFEGQIQKQRIMNRIRAVLVDQAFSDRKNVVAKLLGLAQSAGSESTTVEEFQNKQLYNSIFDVPIDYYVQNYPIQADVFLLLS